MERERNKRTITDQEAAQKLGFSPWQAENLTHIKRHSRELAERTGGRYTEFEIRSIGFLAGLNARRKIKH